MNNNKGFTLLELMVVVAIVGVLASLAVPAFGDMMQRNQLKAALQSVQDDLQFARTQAIKKSQNVTFSIQRASINPGAWCYGLSTGAIACNCTAAASATNCDIKIISGAGFSTVSSRTGTANAIETITFDFKRGIPSGTVLERPFSTTKYRSSVSVSTGGRVRICANSSTMSGLTGLPGLPAC